MAFKKKDVPCISFVIKLFYPIDSIRSLIVKKNTRVAEFSYFLRLVRVLEWFTMALSPNLLFI